MREAAWPLLRDDLDLTYAEIGLLIAVPNLVGGLVQPAFGLLADAGWRRALVLGGGVAFAVALAAVAGAWAFLPLMLASIVLAPASGAFVSLAQATLIDVGTGGSERNMARLERSGGGRCCAGSC